MSQLFVGISCYYADFLSLQKSIFDFKKGLNKSYYNQIRAIHRNNLGIYKSNYPLENPQKAVEIAILNSKVASVFEGKTTKVYYPYAHNYIIYKKPLLNPKNINILKKEINNYERKYPFADINIEFIEKNKQFFSTTGSMIEQSYLVANYQIQTQSQNISQSIRLHRISDFKLPIPNYNLIKDLKRYLPLFLAPKLVSQIALFLLKNKIKSPTLELTIEPNLKLGLNSGLYDDEGTARLKIPYQGLKGGSVFQKDYDCAYIYNFETQEFVLKQPDLSIPTGKTIMKNIVQNIENNRYLQANHCKKIEYNKGIFVLHDVELSLNDGENIVGCLNKRMKLSLDEFKKAENIMNISNNITINESSVLAPYIFVNKNYGFL